MIHPSVFIGGILYLRSLRMHPPMSLHINLKILKYLIYAQRLLLFNQICLDLQHFFLNNPVLKIGILFLNSTIFLSSMTSFDLGLVDVCVLKVVIGIDVLVDAD